MTQELITDASEFADVEGLFEDKQGRGGTYLSIFDFAICQRSKSFATEEEASANLAALLATDTGWTGPHKRTNPKTKADVFSNSKRYDRLIGRIADISKHTKEFSAEKGGGKVTNWDIIFLSGGKTMTLQLTYIDHALKRFLKVAPNIDFTRPILISAFKGMKNGDPKQAISFRQYTGDLANKEAFKDVDKWDKVEEYWKAETGPNGERVEGAVYKGADGSVLPPPVQDEEDDSWDYKAQNKFLSLYFRDNVLPKIKELAAQYGIQSQDTDSSSAGQDITHSGPPQEDDTPVTTKPTNPVSSSLADMISGRKTARIRELCGALGMDPDVAMAKLFGEGVGVGDLTDDAGKYAIYKLTERAKKTNVAIPEPPPPAVIANEPHIADRAKAKPPEEDDDLWADSDATVAPPVPKTGHPGNDDVEW